MQHQVIEARDDTIVPKKPYKDHLRYKLVYRDQGGMKKAGDSRKVPGMAKAGKSVILPKAL